MTIANTFAAKLSVAFVAVAMALSMVAPAQAQTAEELQAQIDSLMATIAALQSQLGVAVTPAASADAYVFTRSLTIGAQGADVTALQNYLIAAGFSIPAGATGYFGTQTQAATAAWQAAQGVAPAVGYFGPISQARYMQMMATVTPTPGDDSDDDSDDSDDSSSTDLSGTASFDDADLNQGDDTDIEEGQEAAPVAEFEVDFTDGDAMITRLDVAFTATSEEDVWDTLEEVSLWVDGDEVASKSADNKGDYSGDEDNGVLRFTGLDIVAMEDETQTIVIAVTTQTGIDDLPATWTVDVTGMRWVDAQDINTTEDNASIGVTGTEFDLSVEGGDDELIVKTSSEDPDSTTLQLDATTKSDWLTVFAFDLDTDDSVNDITLNTINVTVVTSASDFGDLVNDAQLVIDGETYDDWSYASSTASTDTTVVLAFDVDGDHTIDAGDRVTAELQLEFKKLIPADEGDTVRGYVTAADARVIDAEGADDLEVSDGQLSGSATGDLHTLRSEGAVLKAGTMTGTKDAQTDTLGDEKGVFTIKFDVTAFETDLYVAKSAASSTGSASGASYRVTDGSGVGTGTSTSQTASLTSTAQSETGSDSVSRYVVNQGETKTFTLTVNYDPNNVGAYYGIQLYSLNFKTANTAAATVIQQLALPATDYETDPLSI